MPPCSRRWAFFLDIDGTLLDIAETPDAAEATRREKSLVRKLHEAAGGALALVSGRPLDDIDLIFAPLQLAAIGGHGAEMRPVPGTPPQTRVGSLSVELKRKLATITELGPGILVEDKGYSLALHYRLAPEHGPALRAAVAHICAHLPAGSVEILPGKLVVEVKPAGISKALAVSELMTYPPFTDRHPIFIGDDTTDEPVFGVLPRFDGLGFSVGRIVPGANGHFDKPEDVRSWLARIAADHADRAG